MFTRPFAAARTALKESATPPLRRTRDPLLSSPNATHYTLPSGSHFIVRHPPSHVPSAHPLQPQPTPDSTLQATFANSPFTALLNSSSTLLAPLESNQSSLPTSRTPSPSPTTPSSTLSPSQISELQSLRRADPARWTRSKLASKFGISPQVVGRLGWGEGVEARQAERERKVVVEAKRERSEVGWGWKKSIAREERRRRRDMW
ncbi:hypothetical protein JCM11641_000340 [Rhodosporidiobolus odoratus]